MPTQKINWSNVGRGVAYVVMSFGSLCGIGAAYNVNPTTNDSYVTKSEFQKHEAVDSVNVLNKKEQLDRIEALLITVNGDVRKAVIDIAVLKSKIEKTKETDY